MPQPVQLSIRILPRAGRIPATPPPGGSPAGPGSQRCELRRAGSTGPGGPLGQPFGCRKAALPASRGKALRFMGLSKVCGILEAAGYWRVGTVWLGRKPGRWKRNRQRRSISSTMKTKWILTATMWGLGGHARGGDVGLRFRRVHGRCEAVSAGRVPGVGGKARKPWSALRVRTRRTTDQALLQGLLEGFPGRASPTSSETGFGCRRRWRKRGSSSLNGSALTLHVAPGNPACQGGSTACKAGP